NPEPPKNPNALAFNVLVLNLILFPADRVAHLAGPVLLLPVRKENRMRITSKGQVTIPQEIRERLGLLPETDVTFEIDGNAVRIRKAEQPRLRRGKRVVAALRGRATTRMSTDDIMALTRVPAKPRPKKRSK
ncbi:MAG: AbrB/MazE/SpoVT family DNA-binding domain-containing protein, partial [Gemmatimonadota bacterium]